MAEDTPRADESSGEELFMDYMARKKVVLPRSSVMSAVEELLREPERRSSISKRVRTLCTDRSHLRLTFNPYANASKNDVSLFPVVREMRHCLLTGDWDGYKKLLFTLLGSSNITERYIAFVVRSCFVLLFNHPYRTPESVDNFLASCLRIKDPTKRVKYLQDCFLLRGKTALDKSVLNDNTVEDEEEEEEDVEEEMVFYSDCSDSD